MQALILSCSTGGGHNAAALAMVSELKSRGWKTDFFDPYTLRSQRMADMVSGAYVQLVRRSPALFGRIYQIGALYEKAENLLSLPSPVLEAQRKTARLLGRYIDRTRPDLIICSHPYPGMMLAVLKRDGHPLPPSIMIATDYTCIPFETQVGTDWMTIGSPLIRDEFLKAGMKEEQLLYTGIPVDPKFEDRKLSRLDALRALHLNPHYRYILIGAGSMGAGGTMAMLQQILEALKDQPDVHLCVLCGSSDDLIRQIEALHNPRLMPVPFTRHVELWLAACEFYITKPGGLSITESAAFGVPLLLANAIPGCESENAAFFEKQGMALYCRDFHELPWMMRRLLQPEVRRQMLEKQKVCLPHHSARALAEFAQAAVMTEPSVLNARFKPVLKTENPPEKKAL